MCGRPFDRIMAHTKIGIIGGGIVGLATAHHLLNRFPNVHVAILEKEGTVGEHQTGHNSGVLHTGIYYKPGSLKATNCRSGKKAMEAFCAEEGIDFELCGKVIVATSEAELPAMQRIYERGVANGVQCNLISKERVAELEPYANGVAGIHVPEAGIVNYKQVCERLSHRIQARGGEVRLNTKVLKIRQGLKTVVETNQGDFEADLLINCAGLYSDKVSKMSGQDPQAQIIPFRGEYYTLRPEASHLCRNLIYPVPDPNFPFLGVHFTRMVEGGVECGPNAVLAFAREGYTRTTVNPSELWESLTHPGFRKLAKQYWKTGMGEMYRSFSKAAFVKALQKLVPDIREEHLEAAPAGVRAQAVMNDGNIVDDFLVLEKKGFLNVCNAPSPAATASLNVGLLISDKVGQQLTDYFG